MSHSPPYSQGSRPPPLPINRVSSNNPSPSVSPVTTPVNRSQNQSNNQSVNGSPVVSMNHSSMERSTPFHPSNNQSNNPSNRPSLVFEGDSFDGSYSFVISAPNSGAPSPHHQTNNQSIKQSNNQTTSHPIVQPPALSALSTMNDLNTALPNNHSTPHSNNQSPPPLLSQASHSHSAASTPASTPSHGNHNNFNSQSSTQSNTQSNNQSTDDVKTIEFYLKQAISAKDAEALTSLLGKHRMLTPASNQANNQSNNQSINQSLVNEANLIIAEKRAENLHTSIFYLRQAIDTKNRDAIKMLLGKIDGSFLNDQSNSQPKNLSADDLTVVSEARRVLIALDKENVQTVQAYLKQGLTLKNRDLIKQSLEKVVDLPSNLLDADLIATARQALTELDQQHLIKYYLNSAIKQRNDVGLESALEEAKKHKMGSDITEVSAATRLLVELQNRKQKKSRKPSKSMKPSTLSSSSSSSSSSSRLFGGPLIEAVRRSERPIPRICYECMDWLNANSLDEPGLFRVAGQKENVENLKLAYETQFQDGRSIELIDAHDAASVLKLYIRSLPEPLIPYDRYDSFLRCAQSLKDKPVEQRVHELRPLVENLPIENYALFSSLCRFLHLISTRPLNKMTVDNLAIVWAPNLMRPQTETQNTMLYETPISIQLLATLIHHCDAIFQAPIRDAAPYQPQPTPSFSHYTMPQPQSSYNQTNVNSTMQRKFANSQTL